MPFNDDNLLPYVEGALDEDQTAEMAARLASDPELDAEAKRLRRTVGSLRRAAAPLPLVRPADHWPALQARLVLAPASRRASVRIWAVLGAALVTAASLAAFLLLRMPTHHAPTALPGLARRVPVSVSPPPALPKPAVTIKRPLNAHYFPLAAPYALPYAEANPFVPPPTPKPPVKVRHIRRFRRHRRVLRRILIAPVKPGVVLGPPVEPTPPRGPARSPGVTSPPSIPP